MESIQERLRANADLDEMEGCTASVVALEREAANKIDDLESQLAEAKKDQARYQWLLSIDGAKWISLHQLSYAQLDSYIDAAIASIQEKSNG